MQVLGACQTSGNTGFVGDNTNQGEKDAWQEIKAHPRVTVTVDLFWIGLVFFKQGQAKEDFLVKI